MLNFKSLSTILMVLELEAERIQGLGLDCGVIIDAIAVVRNQMNRV